jgi:hypothetical protein
MKWKQLHRHRNTSPRALPESVGRNSPVRLSSTQRLRFEMLGLIEDRADGSALPKG